MARRGRTEELRASLCLFSPLCDSFSLERREATGGPDSLREERKLEVMDIFFHLFQHHRHPPAPLKEDRELFRCQRARGSET